jgi:hypothetical protein
VVAFYVLSCVGVLAMWAAALIMATNRSPTGLYSVGEALAWTATILLGYLAPAWAFVIYRIATKKRPRPSGTSSAT